MLWVRAARGTDGGVYVAWLWSRFISKSDEEDVLELCRVEGDHCAEKTVLSRNAGGFVWANGPNGASGLLLQEYPHSRTPAYPYIPPRRRPTYPVLFVPITDSGPGARRVIDDHVMDGWFNGATDANGLLHFIYVNEEADGIFSFMHRWTPEPQTWSDADPKEAMSEGR